MPVTLVNGIQIAYVTFGGAAPAPAVILMRGVGTQLVHWPRELIDGLAQMRLRVIVFDNRDCGCTTNFADRQSPPIGVVMAALASGDVLEPVYRLEDMALDVVGLLDALAIRQAHFLGLSLGGYVGQILAADYGERLRSFVQVMSSPFVPSSQRMQARVIEAMMAPPRGPDLRSEEDHAFSVAKASTGSRYPIDEHRFRNNFRLARARGVWPGCESRQILAAMATGDRSTRCRRIDMPALIVHGTEDPMVPFDEGQRTADLIRAAEFVPIEGLGHEFTPAFALTLLPMLQSFFARTQARSPF